jgi:hypothetical protein
MGTVYDITHEDFYNVKIKMTNFCDVSSMYKKQI